MYQFEIFGHVAYSEILDGCGKDFFTLPYLCPNCILWDRHTESPSSKPKLPNVPSRRGLACNVSPFWTCRTLLLRLFNLHLYCNNHPGSQVCAIRKLSMVPRSIHVPTSNLILWPWWPHIMNILGMVHRQKHAIFFFSPQIALFMSSRQTNESDKNFHLHIRVEICTRQC